MIGSLNREQVREYQSKVPNSDFSGLAFLLPYSSLDLSTLYGGYSQYRRFVKSTSRLNYLQYIRFDFGRCSAITLTISEAYIKDDKAIVLALNRFERMLRAKGVPYYVIVKELGSLTNRLHYHAILFNAPYFDLLYIDKIWRIGTDIKIKEIKNVRGGVFYLSAYIKKGLNLQWSRGFFKNEILSNDVYYLVKYDKLTKRVYIDNIWNSPYVLKQDYKIFKGRLNKSEMALLIKRNENLNIRRCKGVS